MNSPIAPSDPPKPPAHPPAAAAQQRFALGANAFQQQQYAAAAEHFAAAVTGNPEWKDAWLNLARARLRAGAGAAALAAVDQACALAPADAAACSLQAVIAESVGADPARVVAIRERHVGLLPNNVEAHFLLAMAYWQAARLGDMHRSLQHCLELDPDYLVAHWSRLQTESGQHFLDQPAREQFLLDWRRGLTAIEALPLESPALRAQCTAALQLHTNFALAYLGRPLVAEQARYGAVITRMIGNVVGPLAATRRSIPAGRKRRIGVISRFLYRHSVSKLFMPALLDLDREQFELIGFCPGHYQDDWSAHYRSTLAAYHSGVVPMAEWASRIRAADLDVLLYLDIGMAGMVSNLGALRLAPVQAVFWGHPISTGFATMDWFISSALMEPADGDQHYTEKLLRLPNLGCVFDPPDFDADADLRRRLATEPGQVRAACLQSAKKLSPQNLRLLVDLLALEPSLRLSFVPALSGLALTEFKHSLATLCSERGLRFDDRVQVHDFVSQTQFAAIAASQDFILDSLDWSGGVTALEAFWHDRPILTLPGPLMRGRHTAAMLRRLHLHELIASDQADYLQRARALIADGAWRRHLSERIGSNKHRLYHDPEVSAALAEWLGSVQPESGD